MDRLLAWCIVPFDSRDRSPEERIGMLEELGFRRYAYDWRPRHLPDTARELRLARERGIEVTAVWIWIDGDADRPGQLSGDNERLLGSLAEAGVSTQIWVGINANAFEGLAEGDKVVRGVEIVRYLSERASETGSRVALYNHGDWSGEPENQIRIIEALPDHRIGLVYNFHHGHEHIERFDTLVDTMRPHLWVVNLNGMRPGGPKILPSSRCSSQGSPGRSGFSATWRTPTSGTCSRETSQDWACLLPRLGDDPRRDLDEPGLPFVRKDGRAADEAPEELPLLAGLLPEVRGQVAAAHVGLLPHPGRNVELEVDQRELPELLSDQVSDVEALEVEVLSALDPLGAGLDHVGPALERHAPRELRRQERFDGLDVVGAHRVHELQLEGAKTGLGRGLVLGGGERDRREGEHGQHDEGPHISSLARAGRGIADLAGSVRVRPSYYLATPGADGGSPHPWGRLRGIRAAF
jgi:hypothetical protein